MTDAESIIVTDTESIIVTDTESIIVTDTESIIVTRLTSELRSFVCYYRGQLCAFRIDEVCVPG